MGFQPKKSDLNLNQGILGMIPGLSIQSGSLGNPPGFPQEVPIGKPEYGIQAMVIPQLLKPTYQQPQQRILPRNILDYLQMATQRQRASQQQQNRVVDAPPQTETGATPPRMVNVPWSSHQVPYNQSLRAPRGWHP